MRHPGYFQLCDVKRTNMFFFCAPQFFPQFVLIFFFVAVGCAATIDWSSWWFQYPKNKVNVYLSHIELYFVFFYFYVRFCRKLIPMVCLFVNMLDAMWLEPKNKGRTCTEWHLALNVCLFFGQFSLSKPLLTLLSSHSFMGFIGETKAIRIFFGATFFFLSRYSQTDSV